MIRVIITENIESEFTKIKRFSASGRFGETLTNREYFQHFGFTSRPPAGAEGIVLQKGTSYYLIAEDDRRYRLRLDNDGEVALYSIEGNYFAIKKDNKIEIHSAGSVTIDAPDVKIGGTSGLKKIVDERIVSAINSHTHTVTVDPTSHQGTTAGVTVPIVAANVTTSNMVAK